MPSNEQRAVRSLRARLAAATAVLLCLVAGGVLVQAVVEHELRHEIERWLAGVFPGTTVRVGHVRFRPTIGVELKNVRIDDTHEQAQALTIFSAETIRLSVADPWSLVRQGVNALQDIVVDRGQLHLVRRSDGSWNIQRFHTRMMGSGRIPRITGRRCQVSVCDAPSSASPRWTVKEVDWVIDASQASSGGPVEVRWKAVPPWGQLCYGRGLVNQNQWHVEGVINRLRLEPELWQELAPSWLESRPELVGLRGEADVRWTLTGQHPRWTYCVEGQLRDGHFSHHSFPYTLNSVTAEFRLTEESITVHRATARTAGAEVELQFERQGWSPQAAMSLNVSAKRLPLQERCLSLLPPAFRRLWLQYSPEGLADITVQLTYDGTHLHTQCVAELSHLAFVYEKFPYRVSRARGQLVWRNEMLTVQLYVPVSGRTAFVHGEFTVVQGQPAGWLELHTDGPVPVDEAILAALPDKPQRFVRSLNVTGMFQVWARLERTPEQPRFVRRIELHVDNGTLRYDRFPYALERVRGRIRIDGERVTFSRLTGRHDSAFIVASGEWNPAATDGIPFRMHLQCTDVPLQESLRAALSAQAQRLWSALQPQGTLDRLEVHLEFDPERPWLDVQLLGEKWAPQQNIEGRTIHICPTWLPLRWENVTGKFSYRRGEIVFEDVHASSGKLRVEGLRGRWRGDDTGQWRLDVERVEWTGLAWDQELQAAVPSFLRKQLAPLQLIGAIHGGGQGVFVGTAAEGVLRAEWRGSLDTEDATLICQSRLEHIRGGTELFVEFDRSQLSLRGQLHVDSLVWRGVPLSRLRGPFSWQGTQLVFGDGPSSDDPQTFRRSLTARLFDGDLELAGTLTWQTHPQFLFTAKLFDADLAQVVPSLSQKPHSVGGRLFADLSLSGTVGLMESWQGEGRAYFRDANLYQLPLMIALLKLLNVRPPDPTAFTHGDMQFRYQGDRLLFHRLALQGDAISLVGTGTVTSQRQLDLSFYTLVGREDAQLPAFRPLFRQAARNVLLIDVTGSLDEPVVTPKPFPELNATLQQWLADIPQEPWGVRTNRTDNVKYAR